MDSIATLRHALACACVLVTATSPALGQSSEEVTLLGQYPISGANDIWGYNAPDGTELAIVGTGQSTVFVDVTDPASPVEVASIEGTPSNWRDIKTYSHYAYSVNEGGGGIQVIDLSDPSSPQLVREVNQVFRSAHNVFIDVDAGVLYAVGTDAGPRATAIYDLTDDPSNPKLITIWNEYYVHDIYARDGLAYAACINDAMLAILDVSALPEIQVLSTKRYRGAFTHNTWLTDDGKHCVTTDELAGGHLHVFNVEDPTEPVEVSAWRNPEEPSSIVHNAIIRDNLAFTSWYSTGLQIIDLSDPVNPVRVGYYDTFPGQGGFSGAWGVFPFANSGNVFVSDRSSGLFVLQYDGERGHVSGVVLDSANNRPLPSVEVVFEELGLTLRTNADGAFSVWLPEGDHAFVIDAFGYKRVERVLSIERGDRVSEEISLQRKPIGELTGTLEDLDGKPGEGIEVSLPGTPLSTFTNDSGYFVFDRVPEGEYEIEIDAFGFAAAQTRVTVRGNESTSARVLLFRPAVADAFEEESGWTVGSPLDTATSGVWERADPNGTEDGTVQPEDDHTTRGQFAFVTGAGEAGDEVGAHDVDGGRTTLTSPRFDLESLSNPLLVFYAWFRDDAGANGGQDPLLVEISTDDGENWAPLLTISESRAEWVRHEVRLATVGALTEETRIRFIAMDEVDPSLVEAAIDDLEIFDTVARVRGRVLDEERAPTQATVQLETGPDGVFPSSEAVETGDDGLFSFVLPIANYTVTASSFGYFPESQSVVLEGRDDLDLEIVLRKKPVREVLGRVLTPSGRSAVRNATVRILGSDLVAETDDEGNFTLPSVPIGEHPIEIVRDGFETVTLDLMVEEDAPTELRLSLTPLFTTQLAQPGPNPFRDTVRFSFRLAESAAVDLRVFDIQGREVQRLADQTYPVGDHEILWDGRDSQGELLPQGVYFQRLRVDNTEQRGRLLLVR